jgi:hypothetical protein
VFSNPRRHLVVVVGDIVLDNVVGGRVPDAVVAENVTQRLVEMLRGIGAPDIVSRTGVHPIRRFVPAARNAGFTWRSRRMLVG